MEPLIIEAAINGATSKRRNPNVPRSAEEIAVDALACFDAGAAVVHNHTDDIVLGGDGRHDSGAYLRAWEPVLAERPDAILYPTMSGGAAGRIAIETRYAHMVELHEAGVLGMAVADPASVNLASRATDGSVAPNSAVYENSPADIDWMFRWCREHAVAVHVSIFEPGALRLALGHYEAGTLPAGAKLQFYLMGPRSLSGLPAEEWALDVYLRLLGDADIPWMVGTPGDDCTATGLSRAAIERGGHVRVGLEDYYDPSPARRQPTNAELVREVVALAEACGRPVASCAEARSALVPRG
ncbi:MAG: 3-keto-5-aminohexanoate cleavage protein [Acidimicrobiia bacterium]|nr:3-keto-5-aminohexanoate cleavage protein [Acidimicrobiia bacterium]